jgi:hypothetical protein
LASIQEGRSIRDLFILRMMGTIMKRYWNFEIIMMMRMKKGSID